MSDNLKQLKENLDIAIDSNKGIGQILAQQHNDVFTEFINKSGKYVGLPFNAIQQGNNGVFPIGSFSWNQNPMNESNVFVVTVSTKTLDLNDIQPLVDQLTLGDLIRFKDFVGRSVFLEYQNHSYTTDTSNNDICEINVKGVDGNINYSYQLNEVENCVLEFYKSGNVFTDTQTERLKDLVYENGVQSINVAPSNFEKGVATDIVYTWNVIKNDDTLTSSTLDGNNVTANADGSVSNYNVNGVEDSKTVNLSTVLVRKGVNVNLSNNRTSTAYIPQYHGKMVTLEPSYVYNDLQLFTKYVQSGDSKNVSDTFNDEFMFFVSKKSNAVIKDGNDFVLTIGDFNSTTDFFLKKQVTVFLANGNTETMYLYRTREKVNATVTFKIS